MYLGVALTELFPLLTAEHVEIEIVEVGEARVLDRSVAARRRCGGIGGSCGLGLGLGLTANQCERQRGEHRDHQKRTS
jgi:hypothetical protein